MSVVITTNNNNIDAGTGKIDAGIIKCKSLTVDTSANISGGLVVGHGYAPDRTYAYSYLQYIPGDIHNITGTQSARSITNVAIFTEGNVIAATFFAASDKRFKENIVMLNDLSPFEIMNQLEPVRYTFIDKITKGPQEEFGFIAQKVKQILPNAVTFQKDWVPNLMDFATIHASESKYFIQLKTKSTNIIEIQDDVTKFKTYASMKDGLVAEIIFNLVEIVNDKTFEVVLEDNKHNILDISGLFVYGQFVNDFHYLDKMFAIPFNTACIKELYKTVSNQSTQITNLQTAVVSQQSQIDSLTQQLADLKAIVQTLLPNS